MYCVRVALNDVTNALQNGQTPLSIARRLGYISVVEVLKTITEVEVTDSQVNKHCL